MPPTDDTIDPTTALHGPLRDEGAAWEHLAQRTWPNGAHNNLEQYLHPVLRVWALNRHGTSHLAGTADDSGTDHGTTTRRQVGPVDTLAALTVLHGLVRDCVDQLENELIRQARGHGLTWEELSRALAMPGRRQAQTYARRLADRAHSNLL